MPIIHIEEFNPMVDHITLTIEKDYLQRKFKSEINKLAEKIKIPGFRGGKHSTNIIKKKYGKSLLIELIDSLSTDELSDFMSTNRNSYLGFPLALEDSHLSTIVKEDWERQEHFMFKFEVGKKPDTSAIIGLSKEYEYPIYKIQLDNENLERELLKYQLRYGQTEEVNDQIAENDIITFEAVETENNQVKPGGWKSTFSIPVNKISAAHHDEILTKKTGDVVHFNIFQLEEGVDRDYVMKNLLNFTAKDIENGIETNEIYKGSIIKVTRRHPVTLNQDFFDLVFGKDEVHNEEEAKEKIRTSLEQTYAPQVNSLFFSNIRKKLVELNTEILPLPEDFLLRYIQSKHSGAKDTEKFFGNVRWKLIEEEIIKRTGIEVSQAEINNRAKKILLNTFHDEKLAEQLVEYFLEKKNNQELIYTDILIEKITLVIKELVTIKEVPVSEAEFSKIYLEKIQEERENDQSDEDEDADEEE